MNFIPLINCVTKWPIPHRWSIQNLLDCAIWISLICTIQKLCDLPMFIWKIQVLLHCCIVTLHNLCTFFNRKHLIFLVVNEAISYYIAPKACQARPHLSANGSISPRQTNQWANINLQITEWAAKYLTNPTESSIIQINAWFTTAIAGNYYNQNPLLPTGLQIKNKRYFHPHSIIFRRKPSLTLAFSLLLYLISYMAEGRKW